MSAIPAVGSSQQQLQFFAVIIPWSLNDPSRGNFEHSVWAESPDKALGTAALAMAKMAQSGCLTEQDYEEWVRAVENSQRSEVISVADCVETDLRELLSGPLGKLDKRDQQAIDRMMALIAKRSVQH